MAKLTIPGTTIQYDNPKSLNGTAVDPKTGAPWVPSLLFPGVTRWGGQLTYPGPTTPQPGSYDATLPEANPVLFGKPPPSLSTGGIQIPNSSTTV